MSRIDNGLINMVTQIEEDLEEIKTSQIFGSDSMHINSWSSDLSTNATFRVTLTPTADSRGVLPVEISMQSNPNYSYGAQPPSPVYRFDNIFQWDVIGDSFDKPKVLVRWIGKGTVTIQRI